MLCDLRYTHCVWRLLGGSRPHAQPVAGERLLRPWPAEPDGPHSIPTAILGHLLQPAADAMDPDAFAALMVRIRHHLWSLEGKGPPRKR